MTTLEAMPAVANDLKFIDHLQRRNAEELSFYPSSCFEREIEKQRIILARVNGEPAGYLYHGSFLPDCKVHQACIEYDLRGQLYGSALVQVLVSLCKAAGSYSITLRCGSDIAANGFWSAMGFVCEAITQGGARRMRDINCWRLALSATLFQSAPIPPSTRAQDAGPWRRRGDANAGSQFLRGKALQQYRKKIERVEVP